MKSHGKLKYVGSWRRGLLLTLGGAVLVAAALLGVQKAVGASGDRPTAGHSKSNRAHDQSVAHAKGAHKNAAAGATSCADACTPADQPALDDAAEDAGSVAGSYFSGAAVDTTADTVTVYLDNAPQSVIDQLQATHPGTYVIHNDALATMSTLLQLKSSIDPFALRADGIDIVSFGPTVDGHLAVGVSSDVATAQAKLDSMYGSGIIQVTSSEPAVWGDWTGGHDATRAPSGHSVGTP